MLFEPFKTKDVEFSNRLLRSSVGGRTSAYNIFGLLLTTVLTLILLPVLSFVFCARLK